MAHDRESLRERLRAALPRVAGEIEALALDSILIQTTRERNPAVGASRFGGEPDLPEGTDWPQWQGRPLAFLAQIRLEDVAPFDAENALPHSGMLYFFYDADEQPWGSEPEHRGSWRVLFHGGPVAALKRTPLPQSLTDGSKFRACSLAFSPDLMLPPYDSQIVSTELEEHANVSNQEWEDYCDLVDELESESPDVMHRLLGYPNTIQGEIELDASVDELSEGATSWRLLMQIDSDDKSGWMWGDAGRIYYFIREQDLAARDFSRVWLILQCY